MTHRLHSTLIPESGMVTMGHVLKEQTDSGGTITGFEIELLEFNNTKAFLTANDVGKKRRKAMSAYISVGKTYPFIVKHVFSDEPYDKDFEISTEFDKGVRH